MKSFVYIKSQIQSEKLLTIIIKKYRVSNRNNFSDPKEILQTSILSVNRNEPINAHRHHLIHRETIGTQEVWIVKKGRGVLYVYDLNDRLIDSKIIKKGDIVLYISGGHGLMPLSRSMVLVEVKNGPYEGSKNDKVSINN